MARAGSLVIDVVEKQNNQHADRPLEGIARSIHSRRSWRPQHDDRLHNGKRRRAGGPLVSQVGSAPSSLPPPPPPPPQMRGQTVTLSGGRGGPITKADLVEVVVGRRRLLVK